MQTPLCPPTSCPIRLNIVEAITGVLFESCFTKDYRTVCVGKLTIGKDTYFNIHDLDKRDWIVAPKTIVTRNADGSTYITREGLE